MAAKKTKRRGPSAALVKVKAQLAAARSRSKAGKSMIRVPKPTGRGVATDFAALVVADVLDAYIAVPFISKQALMLAVAAMLEKNQARSDAVLDVAIAVQGYKFYVDTGAQEALLTRLPGA